MNEPFASAIVVKYPNYSGAAKPLYLRGKIEHARILLSRFERPIPNCAQSSSSAGFIAPYPRYWQSI
jgi:hypothetical protein